MRLGRYKHANGVTSGPCCPKCLSKSLIKTVISGKFFIKGEPHDLTGASYECPNCGHRWSIRSPNFDHLNKREAAL